MRDTLKIGLGIVLGLALCAGLCCGGVLLFGAALPPSGEQMGQAIEEIFYPTPEPVEEEAISPLGTSCIVEGIKVSVTEYQERDFVSGGVDWEEKEIRFEPPQGAKFILIHLVVQNAGETAAEPPYSDDFSLIYKNKAVDFAGVPLREEAGYHTSWSSEIFPGVVFETWHPYAVPKAADPGEMVVRFEWRGVRYTWGLGER